MNLVIDVGNTCIKLASVENGEVTSIERCSSWEDPLARLFFEANSTFEKGIVASVRTEPIPLWINSYIESELLLFNHKTAIPLVNGYESPTTLGLDRLAAAVGANNIYPNRNVLVVDCGTAITIDVISDKGVFVGGNISLGIATRFKALNSFTSKLPLLEKTEEFSLVGKNTTEAIRAGVLNGVIFELDSYIDKFEPIYPDMKVIFTGGDAFFFDGRLKNSIFVVPNLVVLGLNRILEHNV